MQDLSKFDPNVEKLTALVAETVGITTVDLTDVGQLETVKKARIKLRDARVLIEKTGKGYRDDAIKYQRDVIEKERSLIAIIEPEEKRLKAFEEQAKQEHELAIRREQLAARMERLTTTGLTMTEEDVLALDSEEFEHKFNELVAEKNRLAGEELERQKKEAQREITEARIQRLLALGFVRGAAGSMDFIIGRKIYTNITTSEMGAPAEQFEAKVAEVTPFINEWKDQAEKDAKKEQTDREEKARKEGEQEAERKAREKKEGEEREAKEKLEREERERKELEGKKKYQKFLTDNGVTKETAHEFKQEHQTDGSVILWRKIGTYSAK